MGSVQHGGGRAAVSMMSNIIEMLGMILLAAQSHGVDLASDTSIDFSVDFFFFLNL